jgi:integrase
MLRNNVDVFSLQKIMGHTSLVVLRRYLAQNDEDTKNAHLLGSPVDNQL